jgi:hypothetical protein
MANRRASKTASSKRGLINTGRDSTLSGDYCPGGPSCLQPRRRCREKSRRHSFRLGSCGCSTYTRGHVLLRWGREQTQDMRSKSNCFATNRHPSTICDGWQFETCREYGRPTSNCRSNPSKLDLR